MKRKKTFRNHLRPLGMNQKPRLTNSFSVQFFCKIENNVDFSGIRYRQSIDFDFKKSNVAEIKLKFFFEN